MRRPTVCPLLLAVLLSLLLPGPIRIRAQTFGYGAWTDAFHSSSPGIVGSGLSPSPRAGEAGLFVIVIPVKYRYTLSVVFPHGDPESFSDYVEELNGELVAERPGRRWILRHIESGAVLVLFRETLPTMPVRSWNLRPVDDPAMLPGLLAACDSSSTILAAPFDDAQPAGPDARIGAWQLVRVSSTGSPRVPGSGTWFRVESLEGLAGWTRGTFLAPDEFIFR